MQKMARLWVSECMRLLGTESKFPFKFKGGIHFAGLMLSSEDESPELTSNWRDGLSSAEHQKHGGYYFIASCSSR